MTKQCFTTPRAKSAERGETRKRVVSPVCIREKDVQRAILDYCKAHRIFVERRNVAGIQKIEDRYVRLGKRGMADLWGIKNGIHWECEVKRPGKEPTDEQRIWLENCATAGARAFWADSLDGFIEGLQGL